MFNILIKILRSLFSTKMKNFVKNMGKNMSLIFEDSSIENRELFLERIYTRFPRITRSLIENDEYYKISRILQRKIKPVVPVWVLNYGDEKNSENVYYFHREISRINSISLIALMVWNQNNIRIYLQSGLDTIGCIQKRVLLETIDDAIVPRRD